MTDNPRAKRKDEWLESMVSDGYVTTSISCAHECEPAIGVCIEGTYNLFVDGAVPLFLAYLEMGRIRGGNTFWEGVRVLRPKY